MPKNDGLTRTYLENAIKHATDLYNRTVTWSLNVQTQMEAILGRTRNNSRLQVFGCPVYPRSYEETCTGQFEYRAKVECTLQTSKGDIASICSKQAG